MRNKEALLTRAFAARSPFAAGSGAPTPALRALSSVILPFVGVERLLDELENLLLAGGLVVFGSGRFR
jgi:hypothetical protein